MTSSEQVIWEEKASMRDFLVNFPFWIATVLLTVIAFIINPPLVLITLLMAAAYFGIVWLTRWNSRYKLTNQRLVVEKGVLSHHVDEIELYRVIDSKSRESFFDRIVGLGTIEVMSSDKTGSILMTKVPGAREKREQLRGLAEQLKQERNLRIISNIEQTDDNPSPL